MTPLLLLSVFVVSTCGLVYELVAGALASYLLGDSVREFSTIIGTYLFAMGVGSYLSRYVTRNQLRVFVQVELLVGVVGGFSAAFLFLAFAYAAYFQLVLYSTVLLIGIGVGLEIPLLMQILKHSMTFRDVVSRVLSFDYIGALIASLAFPLFLLPNLGLIRTSLLFGVLNVLVALLLLASLSEKEPWTGPLKIQGIVALILLLIAFVYGDEVLHGTETSMYPDRVMYASTTPYQRIVLTRGGDTTRLYLNGHLQFDSRDEYRYHEALVHVGAQMMPEMGHALVLGGGDGLAVREVLKYPELQTVTLVDLDPAMPALFKKSPLLTELNGSAFESKKLEIISRDAFIWLKEVPRKYDYIVVDFPDPTNFALGKLYSTSFYRRLAGALSPGGVIVVQSTSPLIARKSFWCIAKTIESVGLRTLPYHAYVPSFGEWGFILAGHDELKSRRPPLTGLRFIEDSVMASLFFFPKDMTRVDTEINRLNNQALTRYYEREWARYGL